LKVIDIKSKINIIHKYLWIFVVAGICFLLIFVAVIMLFITAPTQPISTAKPANIKE
jgi:HAMP domain-containing protein